MKNVKLKFIATAIIIGLLLDGCCNLQSKNNEINVEDTMLSEEMIHGEAETTWDYLLEKDRVGRGVFISEHLAEIETYIGQILIEIIDKRGDIPVGRKQFFSDWALEQLSQINWEHIEKEWKVNPNIYDKFYTLNYIYGEVGYDFCYSFYPSEEENVSDKIQPVNMRIFVDGNGIICSVNVETGIAGEINNVGTFHDEFQEIVIDEGIIYEGKILFEQDDCVGLLSSTDAALSAETVGEVIISVLEDGSKKTAAYRHLFINEAFFEKFKKQKWEQIGDGWKVNRYYDCYCTYIYQKDGYVEFLYYFYPDYAFMNEKEAQTATFKCTVGMTDGKIYDTSLRICPMKIEDYQAAREWKGEKITIVKNGETAGSGNLSIPFSRNNDEEEYIYTNRDMGDYRLCDLIMEDFTSGNIESGKMSKFLADKKVIWLSDMADEIKDIIDAGWQIGQKFDFYYLNHNERAGYIHYRYYFYWNKEGDEREKVIVTDAWISKEGLEKMELHCFFSNKNAENAFEPENRESIIEMEDIAAFLDYDWTAESVLMMDHMIQPEDSARGWEFSIADIDFDEKQEMLISFSSNHCGGNSLYIYKQDNNGSVFSYVDTLATPKRYVVAGINCVGKLPYMDIDLMDVYVNEEKEYRYLSLDCSSFGGDIHGGIYEIILYETVFNEEPKEIVRINYCAPEEREELYFLGNKVYETGKLKDMLTSYMEGYTRIAIDYKTIEKTFARDIVAISEQEREQQLDELYMSLRELVIR